jgi:shikimate dehydrogenase
MVITGKTKITGILGWPVEHSLSPLMQNAAFKKLNLDYVYIPFAVRPDELKNAVENIRALGMIGVNVTIPHKEKVMDHLDEVSKDAELIGAVNTIYNKDGLLKGYNTDGDGFISSLTINGKVKLADKKILLIGAGGAGKAIAVKLAQKNIKRIVITDQLIKKARKLNQHIVTNISNKCSYVVDFNTKKIAEEIAEADILINATPVGMHANSPSLIDHKLLRKDLFVYDVVYNRRTELLQAAQKIGAKHLNGLGMLVYQGALSFGIWTGKKAPVETMRKAIAGKLKE